MVVDFDFQMSLEALSSLTTIATHLTAQYSSIFEREYNHFIVASTYTPILYSHFVSPVFSRSPTSTLIGSSKLTRYSFPARQSVFSLYYILVRANLRRRKSFPIVS